MIVNIIKVKDDLLNSRIEDFKQKGGRIHFSLFQILEDIDGRLPDLEYNAHMIVARQTLEQHNCFGNFQFNKVMGKRPPSFTTDYEKLDNSGKNLSVETFLGPYYDSKSQKVIVKGSIYHNSYFYFDKDENIENAIDNNVLRDAYFQKHPDPDFNLGFIHAFMDPPYTFFHGSSIKERGTYLIDMLNYIFDELDNLKIFSWSTDTSEIFKPGREWWGNYFWTVYNPRKNWYIGIIASDTD
jgi:hypothetical protein